MVPALESALPAEPSLPTTLCGASLQANYQQSGGLLLSSSWDDSLPVNSKPDSARIQAAIDACSAAGGGAVKLEANGSSNAFLAGPLNLKTGVILWVDAGVTLFASRSPNDYDKVAGSHLCGDATSSTSGSNCTAWITASSASNSGIVGDGVIDGRGGAQLTSGNRANVATWWDLAIQTKAATPLTQENPRMVQVTGSANFTLYKITIVNSPKFHVASSGSDNLTAWGVKIVTPSLAYAKAGYACDPGTFPVPGTWKVSTCFQPELVKNTDGFDPGNSKNVTIAYSFISTGDDNIVPKAGSTGVLSSNHLYAHNRFYYGHGMSVGSETFDGLNGMKVWDLVTDGMDGSGGVGLRIKSYDGNGGEVQNILYQNVCMRRVKEPLVFDPYYSNGSSITNKLPSFHDITIQDFHYVDYTGSAYNSGTLSFSGYNNSSGTTKPLVIALNNVIFDSTQSFKTADKKLLSSSPSAQLFSDVQMTLGPNTSTATLPLPGYVTTSTSSGSASTLACPESMFVKFPSSLSPI